MEKEMNLRQIETSNANDVNKFVRTGDMSDELYEQLFDYYFTQGEMPYNVAKARDGDPMSWICDKFEEYLDA
jgi:hypothetical protein